MLFIVSTRYFNNFAVFSDISEQKTLYLYEIFTLLRSFWMSSVFQYKTYLNIIYWAVLYCYAYCILWFGAGQFCQSISISSVSHLELQSETAKMRSNITRYFTQHFSYWSITWTRICTPKIHNLPRPNGRAMEYLFWKFSRKLAAL